MAKRGRNEGTIFQRSDGRWCAVVHLGWENGQRKRKYLYGETRAEVAALLTKTLSDLARGLSVIIERQSLAQFLERWLEESAKVSTRPRTYERYVQLVRLHLVSDSGPRADWKN